MNAAPFNAADISIVIPTYGREQVLVDTLTQLLALPQPAAEILIIDQTPTHEPATTAALNHWHQTGAIRWLQLPEPSIPRAMNVGLLAARAALVLFLDDDIIADPQLLNAHAQAFTQPDMWASSGQVLQPGEQSAPRGAYTANTGLWRDLGFPFWSNQSARIANTSAGNLAVRRERALQIGGFDKRFVAVAHRFETDFARRIINAGGHVHFTPSASIWHLRATRGGTRTHGEHQRSASPAFSVGDYLFALTHGKGSEKLKYILRRPWREVRSRFHLRHPWFIPVKWLAEWRGLRWAHKLAKQPPALIGAEERQLLQQNGIATND